MQGVVSNMLGDKVHHHISSTKSHDYHGKINQIKKKKGIGFNIMQIKIHRNKNPKNKIWIKYLKVETFGK